MKIFHVFLFTICALGINAQVSWYQQTNPTMDEEPFVSCRLNNGLAVGINLKLSFGDFSSSHACLQTFDEFGYAKKKKTLIIEEDSTAVYIHDVQERNDTIYSLLYREYGNDSTENYLAILDTNLNQLGTYKLDNIQVGDLPILVGFYLHKNNIFLYGVYKNANNQNRCYLEKRDVNNLTNISLLLQKNLWMVTGFEVFNTNRYILTAWGGNYYYLDSSFNVTDSLSLNNYIPWFAQATTSLSNRMIMAGRSLKSKIVYVNIDSTIMTNDSLPKIGGYDAMAAPNSVDALDLNNVFFGATANSSYPYLSNQSTWIVLYKIDGQGDLIWHRSFGGSENTLLYCVVAAKDSGAYLLTARYDWTAQTNERDLYIYKIDKNGSMLGTPENGGLKPLHVLAYPNPFQDVLRFEFLQQTKQAVVQIFGLDGKLVHQETISPQLAQNPQISTAHLPNGMYVIHLKNENGESIYREKMVKR